MVWTALLLSRLQFAFTVYGLFRGKVADARYEWAWLVMSLRMRARPPREYHSRLSEGRRVP
jgi:hypothetical protein